MKYTLWLFLGVLFLPHIVFADVKISEVAWMGTPKSQYSEWIELYNDGEEAVSLARWKLQKAGSEPLFTLSKSIAAKGYLLVERTTSSAPDAVEGINDEAGPFSSSGLKNTGEDLSLKDEKGTVVDTMSFSGGWPAGESETGKTMQWNGSSWITAAGTPGAANAAETDVVPETPSSEPEETETDTDSVSSSPKSVAVQKLKVIVPPKPTLSVAVPKSIFQGVPDEYVASFEHADSIKSHQGYFYWNMGDGTAYTQKELLPVRHAYKYAGTYTVHVSYYASTAAAKPVLQSSAPAIVSVPLARVEAIDSGAALRITNTTSKTMDIGRWPISTTEGVRSLPELTLIAPKASIVVSKELLGVSVVRIPTLKTPDGTVVSSQ